MRRGPHDVGRSLALENHVCVSVSSARRLVDAGKGIAISAGMTVRPRSGCNF